jgi:hypothetical protein
MQTTKARPAPTRGTAASLPCRGSVTSALSRDWPHFPAAALFILPVHGAFSMRAIADNSTYFSPRLISAIAAALHRAARS